MILVFHYLNWSWGDCSILQVVIVRTWRVVGGNLDDHLGHPVVHRDTSWDTLVFQIQILSIRGVFLVGIGNHFRPLLIQNV